jgi:hypothetical protein
MASNSYIVSGFYDAGHPLLHADDKTLTPAREELAGLNAELAVSIAEQETAAAPLRRLEHVVAETDPSMEGLPGQARRSLQAYDA